MTDLNTSERNVEKMRLILRFSNANSTLNEFSSAEKANTRAKNQQAIVASSFATDEFLFLRFHQLNECRVKYICNQNMIYSEITFSCRSFAKLYFNCKYTINVDGNKRRSRNEER